MPRQIEAERAPVPSARRSGTRRLPNARGSWRGFWGNRNALKHGARSAEAIALKRQIIAPRPLRPRVAGGDGIGRHAHNDLHVAGAAHRHAGRAARQAVVDMTEPMLALSIRQPWAWAIIHAGKDVENRSENMARRAERLVGQIILIHAGKTFDPDGFDTLESFGPGAGGQRPQVWRHHRRGADRGGHAPPSFALGEARAVADRAHRRAAPTVPPLPGTVGLLPCRRLKKAWICASGNPTRVLDAIQGHDDTDAPRGCLRRSHLADQHRERRLRATAR